MFHKFLFILISLLWSTSPKISEDTLQMISQYEILLQVFHIIPDISLHILLRYFHIHYFDGLFRSLNIEQRHFFPEVVASFRKISDRNLTENLESGCAWRNNRSDTVEQRAVLKEKLVGMLLNHSVSVVCRNIWNCDKNTCREVKMAKSPPSVIPLK